jgi:hypothetical protein
MSSGSGVKAGLIEHRFPVSPIFDLMNQHVLGPTELLRLADVEFTFGGLLASLQNHQVLGPTNFSHQWCEFFVISIRLVELLDSPKISGGEAADAGELRSQIFGEALNHGTPPSLSLLAVCNEPADIPVQ